TDRTRDPAHDMGWIPGSIGETSALMCLIGAAILLFTGIGSWRIMLSMLLGGLTMGFIFNAFAQNDFMTVSPIHQVLMGGFMFGMVFMATDPVSAAQTTTGKWIYGFFAGFFGIMIRVFNPAYPEGIMLSILFMNVMAPIIDHYVIQANVKKRLKRAPATVAA
ncbi:MAG: NADH:ubiquinone reductase (Na(+)-transporting) subunit B, partial [Leptolyngbya sp. SIO3F4]|nr:NADH:ubiquinone reductase (Na(+)-transporting) subunit B [Leptolyngbya sp. SIO3F4]